VTEIAIRRPGAERMGFFTDTTTCIGCKACEVACKQWNDLPADGSVLRRGSSYDHTGELSAATWRHVRFVELAESETRPIDFAADGVDLVAAAEEYQQPFAGFGDWVFMSDVCKHCTHAGCLDACPTGALIRTEFETVMLQPDVCNGCGYCIPACPFGVVDRDQIDGRAGKCTLCYDRLEDGLEPACAKVCPTDSIQFGPYGALDAEDRLAGGLGAFFLLTEPPERYGLPAQADSPIQENALPATLSAMGAGLLAAAGVAASCLWSRSR
jgi:formate dehydrogenase iron-sulfur subunit